MAKKTGLAKCHISTHKLDVSSLEQWQAFRDAAIAEHGSVDGVINNAGVALDSPVEEMSYEELDWIMSINFKGMVYGTKEFLPHLKSRPEALIANVSSVLGLFSLQNQSGYCASKFAIRGFTGSLAQELKNTNILVSSIHPGHIGTKIARNARTSNSGLSSRDTEKAASVFERNGLSPKKAAEIIVSGISKNRRKILVGKDALIGDFLNRCFPEWFVDSTNRRMLALLERVKRSAS